MLFFIYINIMAFVELFTRNSCMAFLLSEALSLIDLSRLLPVCTFHRIGFTKTIGVVCMTYDEQERMQYQKCPQAHLMKKNIYIGTGVEYFTHIVWCASKNILFQVKGKQKIRFILSFVPLCVFPRYCFISSV